MGLAWEKFFDLLKSDEAKSLKGELISLINLAKTDTEAFLKEQGEKLELYLIQLAEGQITKEQFEGYVQDIHELTKSQALKMSVARKARAQRFAKDIANLVLKRLLALIP